MARQWLEATRPADRGGRHAAPDDPAADPYEVVDQLGAYVMDALDELLRRVDHAAAAAGTGRIRGPVEITPLPHHRRRWYSAIVDWWTTSEPTR
jgi:hypothetical protein